MTDDPLLIAHIDCCPVDKPIPESEGECNIIIGRQTHVHGDHNVIIGNELAVYGNNNVILGRHDETFRGDNLFILGVRDVNELIARLESANSNLSTSEGCRTTT